MAMCLLTALNRLNSFGLEQHYHDGSVILLGNVQVVIRCLLTTLPPWSGIDIYIYIYI